MSETVPPGLGHLHVAGDIWSANGTARTELGVLLARAKDEGDEPATRELADRVAASALAPAATGSDPAGSLLVTSVPPNPSSTVDVPAALAAAVARTLGLPADPGLLERRHPTARLRDTAPAERVPLVAAAGYSVTRRVDGHTVVLVDDVILTGTTLSHLARLLVGAGAESVVGVVAARSRRADDR